ncbi:uncharacterized protein VICG_00407 [Vittaforma corneae ATCC 50505]|uniref:Uncharacterized protein n=1 Tax=Vittaforma corneae (strain ATCC 50505) TaxID=993615 RepID=L2GQ94_VITCO|nr:uncharacterized protein VICG_00407 [Vittaforma corneae ATCC 50505]ELA42655.1 hypothetical protein VICG_00407 [Vittaforma corneae ATCC 50505]
MQTYIVLNIFRTNETQPSFIVSLMGHSKEYYKIDKSISERVSKGMIYIGDKIQIKEITADGVIFDVLDDSTLSGNSGNILESEEESETSFFYSDIKHEIKPFINPNVHFLPYLCDILPYNLLAVEEMEAQAERNDDGIFTGKYKVGELHASNIKLPLSGMFIAKIIQKTRISTYPTSFNPFFFAIVSSGDVMVKIVFWIESLKQYSSLKVGDIIMVKEYRKKKKWSAFDKIDINTFTESVYFDVEEITAKELVKIKFNKKSISRSIFETVEGKIEYLSVLMRYNCNDTLMEYVLMHVSGKKVVLFYNSDTEFYKINVGIHIVIAELRKMERAGFEFYVSTIYTQFEIKPKQILKKEGISDSDVPKKTKLDENSASEIFGAIGFLPDSFNSLTDITDYFHKELVRKEDDKSREISINLFMKPVFVALSDLIKQSIVLNESKKFIVNSVITRIVDLECVVDYVENGENKKQGSFAIVLDEQLEVFVYENFFSDKHDDNPLLKFKADESELVGKLHHLVIEAFRADENNILYYLTGLIPN